MGELDRRGFLKLAMAGTLGMTAVGLTGCGDGGGSGDGTTDLRYAWWGNTVRQQNYTKALKNFSGKNPAIRIEPEFADYSAFQERMTTQMAARDVADIFWIASPQVLTYNKNHLYRQLDDIPTLDLSDYDAKAIDSFKIGGKLNTMPFGIFTPVIRYNDTFVKDDGVKLPPTEGDGYTWDAWSRFLIDYSKDNPKRRKGMPYEPDADLMFEAWLRQRGEQLWTEDGRAGFSADSTAAWFDWWENLYKNGAVLTLSEQEGMMPDWSLVGEKTLAKVGNSNHIIDDATQFPKYSFKLLDAPVAPGAHPGHLFLYYPRMAIYQGIDDDKVKAAGTLVNYNTNNVEMLRTVGLTMGAPVNPKLLKQAFDFAGPNEKEMLTVVRRSTAADRNPRFEAPPGSNTWRDVMGRVGEEIGLGKTSTLDGAKKMIAEIQAGISRSH